MTVVPGNSGASRLGQRHPGRRLLVLAATAALGAGVALGSGARPVIAHAAAADVSTPSASAIVATAEQYLGYPYADTGDTPAGFSCIGFVHFVFAQYGIDVPEDLAAAYASAPQVDQSQLQPGDLVFFQNTVWSGISHVDIYVGAGKMIGADSYQTGVQWDTLSDTYWQDHYLGATRPLANLAAMSAASSAPASPTITPLAATMTPISPSATPLPTGTPADSVNTPAPASPLPAVSSGSSPSLDAGTTVTTWHDAAIYSGPDDASERIDVVALAMPLAVVQAHGPWVNVSYDGGTRYGWVHESDLNLQSAARSAAGTAGQPGANSGTATPPSGTATPPSGSGAMRSGSASPSTMLVVQSASVPVYDRPSPYSAVLVTITSGTDLSVRQALGLWDQVVLADGTVGWIEGAALSPASASASGTGTAPQEPRHRRHAPDGHDQTGNGFNPARTASDGRMVVVTAGVLFVRDNAGYHARILRRVHAGDRLTVLTTYGGWDYVVLRDGSRGWVSAPWVEPAQAA